MTNTKILRVRIRWVWTILKSYSFILNHKHLILFLLRFIHATKHIIVGDKLKHKCVLQSFRNKCRSFGRSKSSVAKLGFLVKKITQLFLQ